VTPRRITVHCSDTPTGRAVTVEEIRRWHLERGWSDIGYHFVIYLDGTVAPGRPLTKMGSHVSGANEDNVGVCLVGKGEFNPAQWSALRQLLDSLTLAHGISKDALFCHREFPSAKAQGKSCPGFSGEALRSWYFDQAAHP
jgi:hypothetical protein